MVLLLISIVLATLPLLGIVWFAMSGQLATVDGLFGSLILLTISGIFGINVLMELHSRGLLKFRKKQKEAAKETATQPKPATTASQKA